MLSNALFSSIPHVTQTSFDRQVIMVISGRKPMSDGERSLLEEEQRRNRNGVPIRMEASLLVTRRKVCKKTGK